MTDEKQDKPSIFKGTFCVRAGVRGFVLVPGIQDRSFWDEHAFSDVEDLLTFLRWEADKL